MGLTAAAMRHWMLIIPQLSPLTLRALSGQLVISAGFPGSQALERETDSRVSPAASTRSVDVSSLWNSGTVCLSSLKVLQEKFCEVSVDNSMWFVRIAN